ncbi:MAG TPA: hypothetical protein VK277_08290 [Acidimicrobiales bacterium]|nr:hypothetical protein [Acidimicrobiales bacterium]
MPETKWFDPSQPQTLQGAVIFSYLNAAIGVLFFLVGVGGLSLLLLALAVTAFFIANERRWAYWLAVGLASLYLLLQFLGLVDLLRFAHSLSGVLPFLFALILEILLLHPQSREYEKIWFH